MTINKVYDETTFITGMDFQSFATGGSITEKAGAIIYVSGASGLQLADSPWKVKIDGVIQSTTSHGLYLAGDALASKAANSTVIIGSEGTVWGNGGGTVGVYAEQATDIVNSGLIRGGSTGIYENAITPSSSKAVTITNTASGLIVGASAGINFADTTHDLVVKNAGTIGRIETGNVGIEFGHSLQLTNTGNIYGQVTALSAGVSASKITNSGHIGDYIHLGDAITLGTGNDVVSNAASGDIFGSIVMGGGNDTLTNGGSILLGITFADGDDKMTNAGQATNNIAMGNGNNTFINSGAAGALSLGIGNDTVTNTKTLDSFSFGDGTNKFTNSGVVANDVGFGIGDDSATNSKTIGGAVDFDDGKNTFTNSGTLGSTLDFGIGDDVFKNTGSVTGAAKFGDGSNNATNGGSFGSTITFGIGDDVFKNTGSVAGTVNFGDGNNSVTNSGDVGGTLTFGIGNDVMTNSGELGGAVVMGEGNNTFINTGILNGGVTFGSGNDVFKTTYSVGSTVVMGDGNDTFVGGSGHDDLNDGKGNDSYALGAGDDNINYGFSGTDTFDGGTGMDTFNAFYTASGGLFVNLDTKATTYSGITVAGGSLNTSGGAELGKIKGFESIVGTASADWLHGSAGADQLDGVTGTDVYIGGGGADRLVNNNDGAIDTFVYEKLTDSGITKATRDTITGFQSGDKIDLSALDANTKTAVDDAFSYLGPNVAFGKNAGELRTVVEGGDTIIQGDVNGDGKADFTIDVTGVRTFVMGDFVL